jgi:hypothetical protein
MPKYTIEYQTSGPVGERRSSTVTAPSLSEAKVKFKAERVPQIKSNAVSRSSDGAKVPRVTIRNAFKQGTRAATIAAKVPRGGGSNSMSVEPLMGPKLLTPTGRSAVTRKKY